MTAKLTTRCIMFVSHWHSGPRGFTNIERCTVAAEYFDGRPFRQHGNRRRRIIGEFICGVNNLSADDRENGFDALDLLVGHGKIVISQRNEICQLTFGDGTLLPAFTAEPTAALRVKPQRFFARETIPL